MKGLRKYLTPFAPDQSGAVSVLYELGGLIVICDAGGCAGNVCGFDEPRWFTRKSAVFSAGLRDMDAILGRDDRLVAKLTDAAKKLEVSFIALIGTPVPSVIGTDFRALGRMAEKKTGLPVLTVDSTGVGLYDEGAEKAYLALVKAFAREKYPVQPGRIGVLGVNPLDLDSVSAGEKLRKKLLAGGWEADCYGMGAGLERLRTASAAEKNLVAAPSGLKAAKLLQRRFGTPYEVTNPLAEDLLPGWDYNGKRILVVHQQVAANTLRALLRERGAASVTVATWFRLLPELAEPGDIALKEEDQFEILAREGRFDMIFGDKALCPLAKGCGAEWIDCPQFALSGRLAEP